MSSVGSTSSGSNRVQEAQERRLKKEEEELAPLLLRYPDANPAWRQTGDLLPFTGTPSSESVLRTGSQEDKIAIIAKANAALRKPAAQDQNPPANPSSIQQATPPAAQPIDSLKASLRSARTRKSFALCEAGYYFAWAFVAVLAACLILAFTHIPLWGAIVLGVVVLFLAYKWLEVAGYHWATFKEERAQEAQINSQLQRQLKAQQDLLAQSGAAPLMGAWRAAEERSLPQE